MSTSRWICGFLASMALLPSGIAAVPVYDESVFGDFSNDPGQPTFLMLTAGSNEIAGTTGASSATVIDRDFFTFTLPHGSQLDSLTVLSGTTVASSYSFIGVQAGDKVTIDFLNPDPAVLLGWKHYSIRDVGTDILPLMGDATVTTSQGFKPPLGAGSYTFWVQETSLGPVSYKFDFAVSSIPEPGTAVCLLAGLGLLARVARKR